MQERLSPSSVLRLDNTAAIIDQFKQSFEEKGRGALHFSGIGVRVDYDLYSGEVGPIEFVESGRVHVDYADDVREALTHQVTEQLTSVISLFARIYLLEKLLELGDEKITTIIQKRHGGGGI